MHYLIFFFNRFKTDSTTKKQPKTPSNKKSKKALCQSYFIFYCRVEFILNTHISFILQTNRDDNNAGASPLHTQIAVETLIKSTHFNLCSRLHHNQIGDRAKELGSEHGVLRGAYGHALRMLSVGFAQLIGIGAVHTCHLQTQIEHCGE